MLMTPSLLLFWSSIILSILLNLSSPSFYTCWLALELNTLTFVPFILSSKRNSGEAALKYFLSQTLGSIILMFSMIGLSLYNSSLTTTLFVSSLMLKLGAAPLHAWVPSMVSYLSWETLFLVLTIQKLNPLIILSYYTTPSKFLLMTGAASLIVGSFMGLLQTHLRMILTYSSINQVGWMLLTLWSSWELLAVYYLFYMVLLSPVIWMCKLFNLNKLTQLISSKISLNVQTIFFLNLLSLGGLPPFLGFLPKWMVLDQLILDTQILVSSIMIMTSLITLYYYLRLTYNSFLMNTNQWNFINSNMPSTLLCLTQFNLLSLWLGVLV